MVSSHKYLGYIVDGVPGMVRIRLKLKRETIEWIRRNVIGQKTVHVLTIVCNNNFVFFYLHPQCGMFGIDI